MRAAAAIALFLLPGAASADCEQPASTSDIYDHVETAQKAFTNLEITAFKEAAAEAESAIPCVTQPVQRHLVAELHRLRGLVGAVDRDPIRTTQAFAAARSIEPDYSFPVEMVPEGSPVRRDYDTIDVEAGTYDPVDKASEGYLQMDGRPGTTRPHSWPVLSQYVDAEGKVRWTAYVWPKEPLPDYPKVAMDPGDGSGEGSVEASGEGSGSDLDPKPPSIADRPLVMGAGGAALAAGAMFLGATLSERKFRDEATPEEQLQRLRARTNGLVVASSVTGGVALGLGVAVVFTW